MVEAMMAGPDGIFQKFRGNYTWVMTQVTRLEQKGWKILSIAGVMQ